MNLIMIQPMYSLKCYTLVHHQQTKRQLFQSLTGTICLLVATIAFAMGVDCKGVNKVIHYGPAKNVQAYIKERGDRVGALSV